MVSKLGLIVKEKLDGTKKRRVIVDARRSGANHRTVCPERRAARPEDVHGMLRDMKEDEPQLRAWYRANQGELSEWLAELVAADLTDAFTHFPVSEKELQHCISSAGDALHLYMFVALFFGHKSAPLLLSRLLQGLFWKAEMQLGTYIDDPLLKIQEETRKKLEPHSPHHRSLGIQLTLHKGARGCALTWIGVHFDLRWKEGVLFDEVPEKLRIEILEKLSRWKTAGMVWRTVLRSFAGKLSWATGIYERARWAVAMVYGALTSHEAEVRSSEEADRRSRRDDNRTKDHLVPVKRFELARHWLEALFGERKLVTQKALWNIPETDASPQGCGGLHAYEYPIELEDATLMEGSHRSQSFLEALAIFIALKWWGNMLKSIPLEVGRQVRLDGSPCTTREVIVVLTSTQHAGSRPSASPGKPQSWRGQPLPRARKIERPGGLAVSASDAQGDASRVA